MQINIFEKGLLLKKVIANFSSVLFLLVNSSSDREEKNKISSTFFANYGMKAELILLTINLPLLFIWQRIHNVPLGGGGVGTL